MKKERKYFWCAGNKCGNLFFGHEIGHDKHPISELAQELQGKSLCTRCYNSGLRLRITAEAYKPTAKWLEAHKGKESSNV